MKKRILIALSFVLLFATALSVSVSAVSGIDFDRTASLQVDTGIPGADVNLYLVGDIDGEGNGSLNSRFEKYAVEVDSADGDSAAAAQALELFVIRDSVTADKSGSAGSDGRICFKDLKLGIYLVSIEHIKGNSGIKLFSPVLISLPTKIEDEWKYDFGTTMKHEVRSEQAYCKVKKVWSGDASGTESVTVQLLKDGKIYDERILSDKNGWSYTWSELDDNFWWSVIEKDVPDGYRVALTADEFIYTLENTYMDDEPDQPDQPGDTPDDEPDTPDEGEQLPQTGQLWWPVSIMLVLGLAMILGGICVLRAGKKEHY